ncbi:MAG: hypothetical protein A2036_01040 [Omnitrophica bacterium GWA2_50_21]|nr:MAG: hypothetical protein A2036_01040 [Omnitrophica bacterium GWA2_50_21]
MAQKKMWGFTLVEIMIVVAIIGLLAALTIPNMLRSRINSDEAVAKQSLRTYSTALENYRAAQLPTTYPPDLVTLAGSNPSFIDSILGSGTKQGYVFTYARVNANQYTIVATPVTPNVTGTNTFFVDESGVIRFSNAAGNPIQ